MDSTLKPETAAQPLVFPTGAELYDQIMGPIEPELLTANIPHLDEQYTDEPPEDRAKRYERYTKAYAKYDEAYAAWHASFHQEVTVYRRDALKSAEQESKSEEVGLLAQLEQDIESELPAEKA